MRFRKGVITFAIYAGGCGFNWNKNYLSKKKARLEDLFLGKSIYGSPLVQSKKSKKVHFTKQLLLSSVDLFHISIPFKAISYKSDTEDSKTLHLVKKI